MVEYESGPVWKIPLVLLASPLVVVAIFCGALAALITGNFSFKWKAW